MGTGIKVEGVGHVVLKVSDVTDDATVNDLFVADWTRIVPQNVITLTMNGWLTPTGTLQPIAAAGAVSIDGGANIADSTAGDLLILVNVGAQTITTQVNVMVPSALVQREPHLDVVAAMDEQPRSRAVSLKVVDDPAPSAEGVEIDPFADVEV